VEQLIFSLQHIDPLIIWGLFPRLLGFVYLIAIASLYNQVLVFAGSKGIHPIHLQLKKIKEDYPGIKRFFYFPTLLWFNASDRFLKGLVVLGSLSACYAIYGGVYASLALFFCWITYLSFDHCLELTFPWDCFLFEAGFLALFLPAVHSLPQIQAMHEPLPVIAWAYRWLIFRLMFGFGKFKFFKSGSKEHVYLQGFMVCQPLPSKIGWLSCRLPMPILKLSLFFMFIAEIIAPFFLFIPGMPRLIGGIIMVVLMVGIQLCGNFGFFNLITISTCVILLDTQSTIFDMGFQKIFSSGWNAGVTLMVFAMFVGSILYLPFNNWCTRTCFSWVFFQKMRMVFLKPLFSFYRALAPFRLIHAYGVFPPMSAPAVRWVAIIEGSHDNQHWREYEYKFMTSHEGSQPRFIAPFHPRYDHLVYYESPGFSGANFFTANIGTGNPYRFSHSSMLTRVLQRLMEGEETIQYLFKSNPFENSNEPPSSMRVRAYVFQPLTFKEHQQTGLWWRRKCIGTHYPVQQRDEHGLDEWLPSPETFHWDEYIWKSRAPLMNRMIDQSNQPEKVDTAIQSYRPNISLKDLNVFWDEFLPLAGMQKARKFSSLHNVIKDIQKKYTKQDMRKFETILACYSVLLSKKLEPAFFNDEGPADLCHSYFHLGLLTHTIIGQGRGSFDQVLQNPDLAQAIVQEMSLDTGLYYFGLFYYEVFAYHARKMRLMQMCTEVEVIKQMSGFFTCIPFILKNFPAEPDEDLPIFSRSIHDGRWIMEQWDRPNPKRLAES